jgi:hypothetical protein
VPFGTHVLYRRTHPRLPGLVLLVAPYGLVHYKIILAQTYQALAPETILITVNPQTGEPYAPRIVNPRGRILPLPHADDNYPGAAEVVRRMTITLLERLNSGMKVIITQSHTDPTGGETTN